jgi:hypothetical protein
VFSGCEVHRATNAREGSDDELRSIPHAEGRFWNASSFFQKIETAGGPTELTTRVRGAPREKKSRNTPCHFGDAGPLPPRSGAVPVTAQQAARASSRWLFSMPPAQVRWRREAPIRVAPGDTVQPEVAQLTTPSVRLNPFQRQAEVVQPQVAQPGTPSVRLNPFQRQATRAASPVESREVPAEPSSTHQRAAPAYM